jgi:hypothetical protein
MPAVGSISLREVSLVRPAWRTAMYNQLKFSEYEHRFIIPALCYPLTEWRREEDAQIHTQVHQRELR